MPTNYTQLNPNDPNYVDPRILPFLPEAARRAFGGNYSPGGGPLLTGLQTVTRPMRLVSNVGGRAVGALTGQKDFNSGGFEVGATKWGTHHPAYWKRINQVMSLIGALGVGGAFGGGTFAGGAGGAGYGSAAAGGGPTSASTVDPFLAGGGSGTWESVGGSALYPTLSEGAGTALPGAATAGSATASAPASTSWMNTAWGRALLKGGGGLLTNALLNRPTGAENRLSDAANGSYADFQKYLPPELANFDFSKGLSGIADLLANPGKLSPGVEDAIRARLAAESQNIAQSYRGIASNQAGAAARGNLPVSFKGALQSALDIAQERAQRGARGEALMASDTLRRQDLAQTYNLLNQINQFITSGRGQSLQALGQVAADARNRQAATLAMIGDILVSMASDHSGR